MLGADGFQTGAGADVAALPLAGEGRGEGLSGRGAPSAGPLILAFSGGREKGASTAPLACEMASASDRTLGSSEGAFFWIALAQRRARGS